MEFHLHFHCTLVVYCTITIRQRDASPLHVLDFAYWRDRLPALILTPGLITSSAIKVMLLTW